MDPVTLGMAKADAKRYTPRQANTIIWFGDSITGKGDGPGSPGTAVVNLSYHPDGFWTHALDALGHRLTTIANAGIGGDTTTQMLARIQTDVIDKNPAWCHAYGGVNDTSTGVPLATIKANLTSIWDQLEAAGIRVITGTLTPLSSYTGNQKADKEAMNLWIKNQGRVRKGLIVVDYHAAVAAPASGDVYMTNMTSDGQHPSAMGSFLMGRLLANTIGPLIPANIMLTNNEADSTDLLTAGGRFNAGGNGAANTATDYSDHCPVGTTWTKEARTDGVGGSWQVFTVPNGLAQAYVQFNVAIGADLAVGESIIAAVEYDISNLDAAATASNRAFNLRLQSYAGSPADLIYGQYWIKTVSLNMSEMARTGVLRTPPVVVPAGTTTILMLIQFCGGGTFKLDRASMWNATRQGLVI